MYEPNTPLSPLIHHLYAPHTPLVRPSYTPHIPTTFEPIGTIPTFGFSMIVPSGASTTVYGLSDNACYVIHHSYPRFMSLTASYDLGERHLSSPTTVSAPMTMNGNWPSFSMRVATSTALCVAVALA
jgi:hypothetical protein